MPVDELQQAAYTIISVSPALGLAMDSLAAKTAASSLPALVTSNIAAYETATGTTGLAATVVTGTTIATTGEIVLTAAAIVAVGAFLSWLIDHLGIKQEEATEIFSTPAIRLGDATGILFEDSTSVQYFNNSPAAVKIISKGIEGVRIARSYLPISAVSNNTSSFLWNSSRNRWVSIEDNRLSFADNGLMRFEFIHAGKPASIVSDGPVKYPAPSDENIYRPALCFTGYKQVTSKNRQFNMSALTYFPGGRVYESLTGQYSEAYYDLPACYTSGNIYVDSLTGKKYFYQNTGATRVNVPQEYWYMMSDANITINAQIADRGMWKPAEPLITGDNVVVKLPVIPGATDITDLSQITQETLDNLSENVLDGNLSPETVTEPTVDYAPSSPTVSPPHIDIPPATDAPTFTPDTILPPPLPVISAVSSQFVKLYNPTQSEIATLSSFMLSQGFVDNVLKLFANPADYVLDLAIIPTSVPVTAEKEPVHIGNVLVPELTMNKVTEQYITRDMGSITISPAYHDFVDYQASAYIFLPYIGERELNINDIMGSTLHLTYNIDVLTGACTAMLHVTNTTANTPIDAVLYQWSGNVLTRIPITSTQWSTSIGQIATAVGSMVAGGIPGTVVAGSMLATAGISPRVSSIGNLSSNAGLLGVQTPYVMLSIPRVATPSNYTAYAGRATSKVAHLGDVQGMVVVEDIHLEGLPATSDEISEIENLLHEGVQL